MSGDAVARGSVWWVEFDATTAVTARPTARPAVVVSADDFNRSMLRTVVVVALTSNTALAAAPGNVLLDRGVGGLPKASVVNVTQVFAVDRSRLVEHVGDLEPPLMWLVSEGLRQSLAL
jgi:mRNA interferase MazF